MTHHSKNEHAVKHGVTPNAFYKYVDPDPKERRKLGSQVGRKSNVSKENSEFLVQHTIRADRANDGFTQAQVVENLQRLEPDINYIAAKNYVQRTFRIRAAGKIKPRPMKAKTTTEPRADTCKPTCR